MSAPAVDPTESGRFPPETHITLRLTHGLTSFQVIKPFLPFTKSQVYLLHPESPNSMFPSKVVMKMYDPRYLEERFPPFVKSARPWSLEVETFAAEVRQEVAQGTREFEVGAVDGPIHADEAYVWEEWFYRTMGSTYMAEVGAYERLNSMQGTFIPKLYDTGTLIPSDTRAFEPHVILLEYIHSIPLADIVPGSIDIPPTLYRPFVSAVKSFGELGVYHGDVMPQNILFSPPEAPSRMVLIDFGEAGIKKEDGNEEEWNSVVQFFKDDHFVIHYLQKQAGVVIGEGPS